MKSLYVLVIIFAVLMTTRPLLARDTKYLLPISTGLEVKDPKTKLDGSVKFFFADQETPKILVKVATDVTNLKTNAVGKSDETACYWVFYSAMLQPRKARQTVGCQCRSEHSQLLSEERDVESNRI